MHLVTVVLLPAELFRAKFRVFYPVILSVTDRNCSSQIVDNDVTHHTRHVIYHHDCSAQLGIVVRAYVRVCRIPLLLQIHNH